MHLASPKTPFVTKAATPKVVLSMKMANPEGALPRIPWFKRLNWFFILGMGLMFLLSVAIWLAVLAH